jgi:hypothetical protein
MAAGLGGQKLYIIPQYDMVVVRFAKIGDTAGRTFDDKPFLADILNVKGAEKDSDKPSPATVEP